jgi:CDP-paratose 2-epimerase
VRIVITGGCGFLGSNLAADAMGRGDQVVVFDNLSRLGSRQNLAWLRESGTVDFIEGDVRHAADVVSAVRHAAPDAIFHLAGQVAMTTSIADPRLDFETNALGTVNVLEAARAHAARAAIVYSSTNKVYGDLEQYTYRETPTRVECVDCPDGFDEHTALEFHSPYGCSKGTGDQYMLDYARIFGLRTVVFRHSSMYGGRQFATTDQGWVGWFCAEALRIRAGVGEPLLRISGDGKQVRDLLHARDMIRLYRAAVSHIDAAAGQAFNIGGGMANSLSLLELFALLEELLQVRLPVAHGPTRVSDQRVFVADLAKAQRLLQWEPTVGVREGIKAMLEWIRASAGTPRP